MTAIRAQAALWLGLALMPLGFMVLLLAKLAGVYPATLYEKSPRQGAWRRLARIGGSSTRMR